MAAAPFSTIAEIAGEIFTRIFPDPVKRAEAQAELIKAESEGRLGNLRTRIGAIISESQSRDHWTSRARPGYFYVFYAYLLNGLIVGYLGIFFPGAVDRFIESLIKYLSALPPEYLAIFVAGFLGYEILPQLPRLRRGWEKLRNIRKDRG